MKFNNAEKYGRRAALFGAAFLAGVAGAPKSEAQDTAPVQTTRVTHLGEHPFAHTWNEACSSDNVDVAANLLVEGGMRPEFKDAFAAAFRAECAKTEHTITFLGLDDAGNTPTPRTLMSMLFRDGSGTPHVLGAGDATVTLDTHAERIPAQQIVPAIEIDFDARGADGKTYRVRTAVPFNCFNVSELSETEVMERVVAALPVLPEAIEGEPCSTVTVRGLTPGEPVLFPVVYGRGTEGARRASQCWQEGDSNANFDVFNCPPDMCDSLQNAVVMINQAQGARGRQNRNLDLDGFVMVVRANQNGDATVRIPRNVTTNGRVRDVSEIGYWVGACIPLDHDAGNNRILHNERIAEPRDLADGVHVFSNEGWLDFSANDLRHPTGTGLHRRRQ